MTFDEILEQVIALLKRQGRVSYGALKMRFDLDDEYLEILKEEILYVHESDVQVDERGFTWIGEPEAAPVSSPQPAQLSKQPTEPQEPPPVKPPPPEPPENPTPMTAGVPFVSLSNVAILSGSPLAVS